MKLKPAIKPYDGAAGDWEALESTACYALDSKQTFKNIRNLLHINYEKPRVRRCIRPLARHTVSQFFSRAIISGMSGMADGAAALQRRER
ncbi:hypothetical protein [Sodalis sp.]|uniref:hypothetical protein n=1 Tax=Sodalis sp. (in: enterobacteria) TaxID=1898979 RepID=UPI0038738B26